MSAQVEIRCDCCGALRPAQRPETWWSLEQQGAKVTTTPRDFCSLEHLQLWLMDADVRAAYPLDFAPMNGGRDGGI